MNKSFKITMIVLLSIILFACTGGFIALLVGVKSSNFNFSFGSGEFNSYDLVFDKEYDGDYKGINVDTKAADIKFLSSDNEKVTVKIYGKEDAVNVSENNDELDIKYLLEENNKSLFGFNTKSSRIEVYVPEQYAGKFNVKTNAGDISAVSFKNASMSVTSSAGDIKVNNINELDANTKAGDFKIGTANELKIKSSAGDIKVSKVTNADIDAKFGDIKISSVDGKVKIIGQAGDVDINNLNLKEDSSITLKTGDVKIDNSNEVYFDIKNDIGDTKINNNYRDAKVTFTIKNHVGDVEINN